MLPSGAKVSFLILGLSLIGKILTVLLSPKHILPQERGRGNISQNGWGTNWKKRKERWWGIRFAFWTLKKMSASLQWKSIFQGCFMVFSIYFLSTCSKWPKCWPFFMDWCLARSGSVSSQPSPPATSLRPWLLWDPLCQTVVPERWRWGLRAALRPPKR